MSVSVLSWPNSTPRFPAIGLASASNSMAVGRTRPTLDAHQFIFNFRLTMFIRCLLQIGAGVCIFWLTTSQAATQQTWQVAESVSCESVSRADQHMLREHWQAQHQLRESVRSLAADHGVQDPQGLIVVRHDSLAERNTIHYYLAELPEALSRQLEVSFPKWLSETVVARRNVVLRLDEQPVEVSDEDTVVICCPSLWNRTGLGHAFGRIYRSYPERRRLSNGNRPVQLVAELIVDRGGHVAHVDVVESSGSTVLDKQIAEAFFRARFDPYTVSGVARDTRVQIPVSLTSR